MRRLVALITAFFALVALLVNQSKSPSPELQDSETIWQQHLESIQGQLLKTDRPDEFAKYHWLVRTRSGRKGPEYSTNYKLQQLNLAKRNRSKYATARNQQLNFVERGPGNLPGRTRALVVVPDDPSGNTWIAGAVGGGLWRTSNAGSSWVNLTPQLPSLAVSTLVISASNPDILYAGTGESFAGLSGIRGDGILKSTDGGFSWTQLITTVSDNFQNVNRIVVHPTNPDIVLACTSNDPNYSSFDSGIFKTTNGGDSWTKVYSGSRRVQQLVAAPDNFNIIYAAVNNGGVIKSIDQGNSWFDSSTGLVPDGRVEIAIAPQNPNRMYASVEGAVSGSESDLYLSDDAGANWAIVVEENDGENLDFLGGQGNYDNTITVHPYDEDIVYVGGVNLFKFTIKPGQGSGEPTVLGVDVGATDQFMEFVTFDSGVFFQSKLAVGDADPSEFVSIEWRFGPGRTQMAHRFEVPPNSGTNGDGGPGVPDSEYLYQDYVEVPFEVWDIDNNRQLMVSFRDQQRDGVFNLNHRDEDADPNLLTTREYFYAHAIDYNASTPDPTITVNGGHEVKQLYFMWPVLDEDIASWDPDNLPDSKLTITYGSVVNRFRETAIISDAFNQFPGSNGKNRYFQSFGEDNTANLGLHPDHHMIAIQKINQASETFRMIVTNDGGVYYTNTGTNPGESDGDWIFAGNGYNTSQFYGVDKKPGVPEFIGGMQDNGTYRSPSGQEASEASAYIRQVGGDGFRVAWHFTDPDKMLASSQYNGFRRSIDGGNSWTSATTDLGDTGEDNAPFITWLTNSKKSPNIVYAVGRQGVWRSPDFGGSWELKPLNSRWAFNDLSRVVVSEADPTIVWAGSGMTTAARLHYSEDSGETFTAVNNYAGTSLGNISNIATHPTQRRTAFALFSFSDAPKILRTLDGGDTWEDISGFENQAESSNGFPDVPVFSLLVLPHEISTIWAGTEIGLVESTDNGVTWSLRDDFVNTSIWEIKAVDDQVVLATHGRGIWSVTLDGLVWPTELVTSIPEEPKEDQLQVSNFPNPVSGSTTIRYVLPESTEVKVRVINSSGQLVSVQDLGKMPAGPGLLSWFRHPVTHSSGVYLIEVRTSMGTAVSRMVLE
ncbi:MAG: hypothetical protein DHS20C17_15180 [Cyclobacteriaceae bacterium]|nr:MAG: hypothetical protein DHS20C17_15180 [Cyclobacteriaceae bacterium]